MSRLGWEWLRHQVGLHFLTLAQNAAASLDKRCQFACSNNEGAARTPLAKRRSDAMAVGRTRPWVPLVGMLFDWRFLSKNQRRLLLSRMPRRATPLKLTSWRAAGLRGTRLPEGGFNKHEIRVSK